jgi:uncharacterized protein YjiS (DUF1127 family)
LAEAPQIKALTGGVDAPSPIATANRKRNPMSVSLSDTAAVEVEARRAQQAYLGRLVAAAARRTAAALLALPRRIAKRHARGRAYDYLVTLDDRLLADIGLSRSVIRVELANAEAGVGPHAAAPVVPAVGPTVAPTAEPISAAPARPTAPATAMPRPANQHDSARAA